MLDRGHNLLCAPVWTKSHVKIDKIRKMSTTDSKPAVNNPRTDDGKFFVR